MVSKNKIIAQRIVKILAYLKSKREDSIRQVSLGAKLSYNSCYNTILELSEEGIVSIIKKNGVNYCSLSSSEKAKLLLAYLSLLEKESFLENKIILKKIVSELLVAKQSFDVLALFGSYAKGTSQKNSDIDFFCISNDSQKIKLLARHLSLKYGKNIQVVMSNKEDFLEMLKENKVNVGTEVVETGIILYGYENYWSLVK